MDTNLWKLIGGALALIISCGTVYKMYMGSLRNKTSTKELVEADKEKTREIIALKQRLDSFEKRMDRSDENCEKFEEKITKAVDKLADRVYDNKK